MFAIGLVHGSRRGQCVGRENHRLCMLGATRREQRRGGAPLSAFAVAEYLARRAAPSDDAANLASDVRSQVGNNVCGTVAAGERGVGHRHRWWTGTGSDVGVRRAAGEAQPRRPCPTATTRSGKRRCAVSASRRAPAAQRSDRASTPIHVLACLKRNLFFSIGSEQKKKRLTHRGTPEVLLNQLAHRSRARLFPKVD